MSLTLPPDAMEAVVAKAILDNITPETRDSILAEAVAKLIETPPRPPNHYGPPPLSPLREAFESATRAAVTKVVRDMVENSPEAQAGIVALVSPVIAQIAAGSYDGLPDKIGEAIGAWLQERSR